MGRRMNIIKLISLVGALLVFMAGTVWAGIPVPESEYTGSRTTPGTEGLNATGGYQDDSGGVKIAWKIFFDGTYWNYEYTITDKDGSTIQPDLSHWILEISPEIPLDQEDIHDYIFEANADIVTPSGDYWKKDDEFPNNDDQGDNNGNPNLGTNSTGIKFDTSSDALEPNGVYAFKSVEPPIWGDVYLK